MTILLHLILIGLIVYGYFTFLKKLKQAKGAILSDKTILEEMKNGNIVISPFQQAHLNPNSVDLTLAPQFKMYPRKIKYAEVFEEVPEWAQKTTTRAMFGWSYEEPLDPRSVQEIEEFTIPEEGYILQPGEVYLYACAERIGVKKDIRAKVEGKSSLGRLGLFIHVTAGFIDTGFEGSLVLELVATRPIRIYPYMKIAQIEFARVEGDILETYDKKKGSKYMNQSGVQESLMHKNN